MKARVLYVDDEVINTFVFSKSYENDFDITTARSGEEAIAKLKDERFDVLVTDMRMPGMTGLDLVKKAKEMNADLPCFIISGYPYDDEIQKAMDDKLLLAFFSKPYDSTTVLNALKEAVA